MKTINLWLNGHPTVLGAVAGVTVGAVLLGLAVVLLADRVVRKLAEVRP